MPDEHNITHSYIIDFIRGALPKRTGILAQLEEYAKAHEVPIIQPEVAAFLGMICRLHRPQTVLEVGTAIGYSALLMLDNMPDGGNVVTIERDPKMAELARENFANSNKSSQVELLEADAQVLLEQLDGQYDMIFMDAAKAHYIHFLPHCIRLLKPGGLLVSDNVLYGGMVVNRQLLIRRKITIVKRLQKYIQAICNTPELQSSILSVGDGIALSWKL